MNCVLIHVPVSYSSVENERTFAFISDLRSNICNSPHKTGKIYAITRIDRAIYTQPFYKFHVHPEIKTHFNTLCNSYAVREIGWYLNRYESCNSDCPLTYIAHKTSMEFPCTEKEKYAKHVLPSAFPVNSSNTT